MLKKITHWLSCKGFRCGKKKDYQSLSTDKLAVLIEQSAVLLVDIRDPESYQQSHIGDAINVDKNQLAEFITAQDKDRPICVYCYRGVSCIPVAQKLASSGFATVYSLDGGYQAWFDAHNP